MPLVQRTAMPTLKELGKTALNSAGDFAKDVAAGRDLHEAANQHMDTAVSSMKQTIEKKLSGGKKRKRLHKKRKSKIILKKHKQAYDDIFN
jgi:hypothetical protein